MGSLCALTLCAILGPAVAEAQWTCQHPTNPAAVTPAQRDSLISACRDRIAEAPRDTTAYMVLESALLGRPDERLSVILAGLRIAPRHPYLWGNLGFTYRQLDRREESLAALKRAMWLAPDESNWPVQAGLVAHDLVRYDQALALFDEGIRRDPGDGHIWGFRARTLHRLGRHSEAIDSWNTAERMSPNGFIEEAGDRAAYDASRAALN
jgi:tetratricopeptide (TPR) repeat protein